VPVRCGYEPAYKYAHKIQDAVNKGTGIPPWDFYKSQREKFLKAARAELGIVAIANRRHVSGRSSSPWRRTVPPQSQYRRPDPAGNGRRGLEHRHGSTV
jgi:hypothetical protein